jgi:membrane-bound lytic murein transglycosylase B
MNSFIRLKALSIVSISLKSLSNGSSHMYRFSPLLIVMILFSSSYSTEQQSFDSWLKDFRVTALQKGISVDTVNEALADVTPISRVIELDKRQLESTMTFDKYYKLVINQTRINQGRKMMAEHKEQLAQVEQTYGLAPQYIVALWGIETNYGSNTGGFNIVPALATLAWDGRRSQFFTKELINALKILDEGHVTLANLKGSWAGAMGQNQFMPSSFDKLAVDGDGDGRKDIWTNKMDIFSSSALS